LHFEADDICFVCSCDIDVGLVRRLPVDDFFTDWYFSCTGFSSCSYFV